MNSPLPIANQSAIFQSNDAILRNNLRQFPDTTSMYQSSHPNFPDWINNYQPIDSVDEKLLGYFRQLYTHPDGSKDQHRAIQQIYNVLISRKLLADSSHDNYDRALEENFNWAKKAVIIITTELKNILINYCQHNSSKIIDELSQHLNTLREEAVTSKRYRETENYLRVQIEKLSIDLQKSERPSDRDFLARLQPQIKQLPRIKTFAPTIIFNSQTLSFKEILATWINSNLRRRINDLYNPNRQPQEFNTISANTPISQNEPEGNELLDRIPSGAQNPHVTLDELMRGDLFDVRAEEEFNQFLAIRDEYLRNDPYGLLTAQHVKGFPECTYKILASRLLLKQPPDSQTQIAADFNIPYQKLASAALPRHFYPTMAAVPIELGYQPELLKQAILADVDGSLRKCHKIIKEQEVYHAQSLALCLLPFFQTPQNIFKTVVDFLGQQGHQIRLATIVIYEENQSYEVYNKIAIELQEQGYQVTNIQNINSKLIELQRNVNSYDVKTYWETAIIEKIVLELNQRQFKSTTQEVYNFWQQKCLKQLGKLVIKLQKEGK